MGRKPPISELEFFGLYKKALASFNREINTAEERILTIPLDQLDEYVKESRSPSVTVLPEYISFGVIKAEEGTSQHIRRELNKNPLPALGKLRATIGVTYDFDDLPKAQELAQLNILRLFLSLDFECSKCSIIDTQGFGANAKFIRNASPRSELITDLSDVENFVKKIQFETRTRIDSLDPLCNWLYEHNAKHRDQKTPYHFIYIADFASAFTDENEQAFTELLRVLRQQSAAMAGIYLVICNPSQALFDELENSSNPIPFIDIFKQGENLEIRDPQGIDTSEASKLSRLCYDIPAYTRDSVSSLITHCQKHLTQTKLTIVEYEMPESEWNTGNSSKGISVSIGKTPKGKYINFSLGSPSIVFNALIGGAVGTGKTVLLHAIIMAMAQKYSPDELAISILDYKEGTEFIEYKDLPHLYALSAGPNIEFGVELMKHLNELLSKRGLLFKGVGASSLEEYREKSGKTLSRHIILIDEFQVLLGDEKVGDYVQQMVEDLVRRGRSFGFNFIFSTQSLADYSLTQSLSSNIGLRICLRLSTSESSRFLDISNEVPSTFTKPGQALLNIGEGRVASNQLFQVAYYSEEKITSIMKALCERSSGMKGERKPFIYESDEAYTLNDLFEYIEDGQLLLAAKQALDIMVYKSEISSDESPIMICGRDRKKVDRYLDMISNQLKPTSYQLIVFDESLLATKDLSLVEEQFVKSSKQVWVVTVPPRGDSFELEDFINRILIPNCELLILRMNECHLDLLSTYRDRLILFFDDESYLQKNSYMGDLQGKSLNQDFIACMKSDQIKYLGPHILP